jgi:molecular chaperone GrpE
MSEEDNKEIEESSENQEENIVENKGEDVAILKDQLMRAIAETDNMRKRSEKQLDDVAKYAIVSFARDIIGVMENFHRVTEHVKEEDLANPSIKTMFEGVEMIKKELQQVLDRNKIERIAPEKGEVFDHNFHQAVAHVDSEDISSGGILQLLQAGYKIHDRLLKAAMVTVAK